jgi:hypothetical protein
MAEEVDAVRHAQAGGARAAAVPLRGMGIAAVADDDGVDGRRQVAQPGQRRDQHRHPLVRRQPADEQQQPGVRRQPEPGPQRLTGRARREPRRVDRVAQAVRSLAREAGVREQFVPGEAAVGDGRVGAPHQAAEAAAALQGVAVVGAAESGRGDAVVVEDDPRLAPGQQG